MQLRWRNLAFQDHAALLFHGYMTLRILLAPESPNAHTARPLSLSLLACTLVTIVVVRGQLLPPGFLRALVYRVGMVAPFPLNYFVLRYHLPALQVPLRDLALLRIDEAVLGATPAAALAPLASPAVVEWFSFFYYSYFTLLVLHVLGSAFFDRGTRLAEMMLGALLVTGIGHALYTLVPGVGPYGAMPFANPLVGGTFYGLVMKAVHEAGAVLDIFPSLHTGHPCFFLLHSLRHRRTLPFRYTAAPMAFFFVNIVVATMLLRWHYAIDVAAGVLVAVTAQQIAIRVARREADRPGQPVWEPLTPASLVEP